MKLSQIEWGDDSAEKDPSLLEYFVRSDAFRRISQRSKGLVVGRKGSGKSALRKALSDHFSKQTDTHVINLSPSYNAIRNVLNDKEIADSFGQEIFFQHTWLRQILLDSLLRCRPLHEGQVRFGQHGVRSQNLS
jgi:energy-coupling factor transporter ATP-binding protein EcfA2